MNAFILVSVIVSIFVGVTTYIASNNIIISVIALALFILYFFIFGRKMFTKYQKKVYRFNQCYHFINAFIISLSIKKSISAAYESAIITIDQKDMKELETIDSFDVKDWLNHLNKYFRFHIFSLFIDLININEEQGGNILEQSKYLLEELRNNEQYISQSSSMNKRKIGEFAILWALTYMIMIFMRFALSTFFTNISKQLFFALGILLIDSFCLFAIHLALAKAFSIKIRGWDDV